MTLATLDEWRRAIPNGRCRMHGGKYTERRVGPNAVGQNAARQILRGEPAADAICPHPGKGRATDGGEVVSGATRSGFPQLLMLSAAHPTRQTTSGNK